MMNIEQAKEKLKAIGLKKAYKPYIENDGGTFIAICLEVRKPVTIDEQGDWKGVEIDIYDNSTVRVCSNRKQLLVKIAKENGFKVRPLDDCAELYLPVDRADPFLHKLGARVKKTLSPENLERAIERAKNMNKGRSKP